jgi:bifunctional non-homologous end joining protein LigD
MASRALKKVVPVDLPEELAPELATLVTAAPRDQDEWTYEIKFDGYRMLTRVAGGTVRIMSRNNLDWTAKLVPLHDDLCRLDLPDGWYDGEIIVRGENGQPDFGLLQNSFDRKNAHDIVYYLFDAPYLAGVDQRDYPVEVRRAALEQVLSQRDSDKVMFSAALDAPASEMMVAACQMGLEGLIGKRKGSAYVSRRSADWIKLKCGKRQEFVVGGYTDPGGSRAGFGSLLLGTYDLRGNLIYAGSVGSGFGAKALSAIYKHLTAIPAEQSPFAPRKDSPKGAHWVEPRLVAEVAFAEWTHTGSIRHSTFKGMRTDKPPAAIRREEPTPISAARAPAAPARPRAPTSVKITNGERVVDARSAITKADLIGYYAQVGELMVPHLQGRPVSLVRAPDGVGGELFFQKHAESARLVGVRRFSADVNPGHAPMLEVPSAQALVSTAQWNVIEYHTQNAGGERYSTPDRMIFDLDPGEGVSWTEIQEAAQLVHAVLQHLGLNVFLKTSGGKGLHLVVPIEPAYGWDTVKDLSKAIVVHMAKIVPERFSAKSGAGNRRQKIFIDYLRNGRGATTACAWSARARAGLGISVPVGWDELDRLTGGDMWTVATVAERLTVGNGPWKDYATAALSVNETLAMLEMPRPKKRAS